MNFEHGRSADEVDELVAAVSHHHRREALEVLRSANRPLALADLATELVRRNGEDSAKEAIKQQAERLQLQLYHCHVPKLAEAGLVEYNAARKTVSLTEKASEIDVLDVKTEIAALGQ